MSRGMPDHGRRNLPFSASLRHRWWCDLVMRGRRLEKEKGTAGVAPRNRKERGCGKEAKEA